MRGTSIADSTVSRILVRPLAWEPHSGAKLKAYFFIPLPPAPPPLFHWQWCARNPSALSIPGCMGARPSMCSHFRLPNFTGSWKCCECVRDFHAFSGLEDDVACDSRHFRGYVSPRAKVPKKSEFAMVLMRIYETQCNQ
jgi:hypothetical protein